MAILDEIKAHKSSGPWRKLEALAHEMVEDAQTGAGLQMNPCLGGGTRLMLELEHRISDDIDLFIRDPQWIGYLTPRLNDAFEDRISSYSENSNFIKFGTEQGEIDFIVAMSLLGLPAEKRSDSFFDLEPVSEVIAKKLFYRGFALTPRDLFDWRAAHLLRPDLLHTDLILSTIGIKKIDEIMFSLSNMKASDACHGIWSAIKTHEPREDIQEAIEWAESVCQQFLGRTPPGTKESGAVSRYRT